MNPGWIGPSERWPNHSRPRAREALGRARAAGWWLKKSAGQGKPWGIITCADPSTVGKTERCSHMVLSTSGSADGSETAETIFDAMRKCVHAHGAAAHDLIAEAEGLLRSATRCLDAAEHLLTAEGHRELLEDFLTRSVEAADEAEELLIRAVEEEAAAEASADAAAEAASEAGLASSIGARDLAQQADRRAAEASGLLVDATEREARILRDRCRAVKQRARALLDRV